MTRRASDRAVDAAYTAQREFQEQAAGSRAPRAGRAGSAPANPGMVLAGRGYNIYDRGVNCDIPRKLRHRYGANVIPLDFLVTGREPLADLHANMFWISGRKILEAARIAAGQPNLHLVYITNFKCGPDSYIKHFAREAAGAPLLILQFDGHGNDAGYMTRCEAYLDSKGILRCYQSTTEPRHRSPKRHRNPRRRPSTNRQAHLHSADGLRQRARLRQRLPRHRPGRRAHAALRPPHARTGRALHLGRRMLSRQGDRGRLHEGAGEPGVDQKRIALFMPTAQGPCRFGQYAPYLRQILDANGYAEVEILSPTSQNAYDGLGTLAGAFVRTGWRALLSADLLQKLLLMHRPYEERRGDTEEVYEESLADLCRTLEQTPAEPGVQLQALRDSHGALPRPFPQAGGAARHGRMPLIGIVGEIFCRLNTFSNENLVQRLEAYGAEAWLSDIVEWIWYTNSEHFRKLKLEGRLWTLEALGAWVRKRVQKHDEHVLVEPFEDDFAGREEPDIYEILECARPYLPREGAFGEMVLNVGKAVYLAKKGAAGIIDISPFTCMNGIVCEAIYPRISRDLGGIPIRNFYFDGTQSDLDRDLGVYMELARSYQSRTGLPARPSGVDRNPDRKWTGQEACPTPTESNPRPRPAIPPRNRERAPAPARDSRDR